jgi:hypothetical protein
MMTTSSTGPIVGVGDMYKYHDFLVVTESASSPSSSLLSYTNNEQECWTNHNNNNNNKTDDPSATTTLMKNCNIWNSKLLLLPATADSINEDCRLDLLFEEDDNDNVSVASMASTMMRFCLDDDGDHHQQQDNDDMMRTSRQTIENIIDVAVATIKTYQEQRFASSSAVKDDTMTNQTTSVSTVIDRDGKLSDLKNERATEKEEEINSTCSSTLDDWDEVFGEDGSISENCDCELRRLPFTMIETNNNEEEGGEEEEDYDEVLINPTTENWDSLFGQDDNKKHKEEPKKSDLSSSSLKSLAGKIFGETRDSDINSRYDINNRLSPMTDESSSGINDKDKENPRSSSTNTQISPPPGFSCQKMEIQQLNNNCTVTMKTTTTKNDYCNVSNKIITVPTNKDETESSKRAQPKQKEQQQQYDSVWDVNFLQEEEEENPLATKVVPMNDGGTVVSDTPEDWEALLDDDEESVSGTRSEEDEKIPPQDDIVVVPFLTSDGGSIVSDTPEDWEALLDEDDESVSGTSSEEEEEETPPEEDNIEDEKTLTTIVVPSNDGGSMVSDTPEDWEALLDEDGESVSGTRSEEEEEIPPHDDIIRPQEVDAYPSKLIKKRIAAPAKNIDKNKSSKRAQSKQQQQYDSVWDINPEVEEKRTAIIVPRNDGRAIVPKEFASLDDNSDPPEDWEALLADEEEESISGTRSKEIPRRDDIVITQEVEAFRSKIFTSKKPLILMEKKKIIDCATTSKKNLRPCWKLESSIRYNSVWEMCSKKNDECRLDHNHDRETSSSESTPSLTFHQHQCSEPQVEWEDLYS